MKISYAITVKDELNELQRLVNFLIDRKRTEDEIVILLKCLSYESAEYFGPKFLTQDWPSFRNDDKFIM